MDTAAVVEAHRRAGRMFTAAGVSSFVREQGDGDPVVCMHGVPASSFLYRKLLPELAARGLRGVAFDLPGLGLADRPAGFDYTWTGLGRFAVSAVDALGLDRFHLVVHDIGGPVGFELAAAMPDRVRSLTLLNTLIEVDRFRRPWVMRPFAWPVVGELWLAAVNRPLFVALMRWQGVQDRSVPAVALAAHYDLLKRGDRGRAFLQIMRGFELTAAKRRRYRSVVRDVPYPVQIVWGAHDPALRLAVHGRQAAAAAGLERIHTVPGKHFVQEDQAPAVAEHIAALAAET
ncbi:alpha/beta fold hydrolase [Micromonospora sp. CPCC 205371]|nr:alpha/beta fold hydrolase [Micromonospora sp. CPCC 205371]